MQNTSNKNLLYFIYSFTILTVVLFSLATINGIIKTINAPREINIPVNLTATLEDQGHIQYEGGPPLDIKFSQIKGKVTYIENNPANAPIAWVEIIFPFTRIILYLFVFVLTAKIMQTSINEEPFISANADRLKWISYSLLLMGTLRHVDAAVGTHILETQLVSQYVTINATNTAYAMGKFTGNLFASEFPMGIFVFFIATLFKHGIAIREENELTI